MTLRTELTAMLPIIEGIDQHLQDVRSHIFNAEMAATGNHKTDLRRMGDDIDALREMLTQIAVITTQNCGLTTPVARVSERRRARGHGV